jgi:hypothetical protein
LLALRARGKVTQRMMKLLQMMFMVGMLHLVALTAALAQPEWASDLGLHQWTWTSLRHPLAPDPEWSRPNREAMERNEAQRNIVAALIEGRLTLLEAAAHFRRLNGSRSLVRMFYRGDSEEECLCRQVIQVTETELRRHGQDQQADEFTARWEEELRRHLEQHGKVILPPEEDMP